MKLILCYDTLQQSNTTEYEYVYQGNELHITEGDDTNMHQVAIFTEEREYQRRHAVPLYRFVSALCWNYKMPVYVGMVSGFGYDGGHALERKRFDRIKGFEVPHGLIEPESFEQEVALGLYREARSADSPFYGLLAYFKILELITGRPRSVERWINDNIMRLNRSKAQIEELQRKAIDLNIGKRTVYYRNSIAHALGHKRPIDIDGYLDMRELNMLNGILAECAEHIMAERLGFTD